MSIRFRTTLPTLFLATAVLALAQPPRGGLQGGPQGSVSGRVLDNEGGPLKVATVAIRNASDSTLVAGDLTDADGRYSIGGLRPGKYYARISYVGFEPTFVDLAIAPGKLEVRLDDVRLAPDATRNEVTVSAEREFMTVGIDRTIYKSEDIKVAAGGSASDLLRNIPSIEVDMDGNVSLRGNQNVVIQVNGRPIPVRGQGLAALLRSFPANSIERIEVIPNPSAKFDPDGMGGIINIVLKQETGGGLSGSVNGGIGTGRNYTLGANINYGDGPWNIFANYGFFTNRYERTGDRHEERAFNGPLTILDVNGDGTSDMLGHTFSTQADYSIDKQNSVSLSATVGSRSNESKGVNAYRYADSLDAVTARSERRNDDEGDGFNMDYRLSYKWVGEPMRNELSVETRYSRDRDEDASAFTQQTLDSAGSPIGENPYLQNTNRLDIYDNVTAQVDYTKGLWEGSKMEAGYKWEFDRIDGAFFSESFDYGAGEFRPDTRLNNSFLYDRQTHAAYATLGQEVGDFGAQIGLRAEQALTDFTLDNTGEKFDNDYFSLFPSAFVSYKPLEGLQLRASYSRRIQRPWIRALNPFGDYDDPTLRRVGNPYLKPEYTDSYELSAVVMGEGFSFTLNPYFRRSTDALRRFDVTDSNGVRTLSFVNFATVDSWGSDAIATLRLGWLMAFANVGVWKMVSDASNVEENLAGDALSWNARINATVTVMEGLDVQMTYFYRAPFDIEGGRIGSYVMSDLAIQQKFLENRATVGVRISDVFDQSGFEVTRRDRYGFSEGSFRWDGRRAALTFSYAFGDQNQRTKRPRGGQPQAPPVDTGY